MSDTEKQLKMCEGHHSYCIHVHKGPVTACTGPIQDQAWQQFIMVWRGTQWAPPFPAKLLATEGFQGEEVAIFSCLDTEESTYGQIQTQGHTKSSD